MRQNDQSHGSPARGPSPIIGFAELGRQLFVSARAIRPRHASAISRQRASRRLNIFLAQDVAHADAQLLRVLEAVQDRIQVLGPAAQLGQRCVEHRARRQLVQHQAVHQLVDHARVAGQNARQKLAGRAELDVQRIDGGLKLNSSHSTPFTPQRIADLSPGSPASNRGRASRRWPSAAAGRSAAKKCRQRRVEQKRNILGREPCKLLIRHAARPETDNAPAPRLDLLGRRVRIEHQVDLGLGLGSSPKASCSRWSRILRFSAVFLR